MLIAATILAATATLTVEDYVQMPSLSSPQFSPDGTSIAYVVTLADMKRSAYDSDIWLVNADGSRNRQLTRSTASDFHPRFAPAGTRLAFLSDRDGRNAIYVLDTAGGEPEKLTSEPGAIRTFSWSPDGKSIAFLASDPAHPDEERRTAEKDDARVVGENIRQMHLHVIDVEKRARRLTRGPFSVNALSWSPDGKTIAIERLPGTGLDDYFHADLYTVPSAGACDTATCPPLAALVVRRGLERMPQYSPDGKWIAFTSTGGVHDWLREHNVYVVPATGGEPRLISGSLDRTPDGFDWSPDGRTLYINGPWNLTTQLFRVRPDGSGFENISRYEGLVTDAAIDSRGARAAFIRQSLTAPPELYIADLAKFEPRRLTDHNVAYRSRVIGETRIVRWKNPKDGLEIDGLLTLPPGISDPKALPLLTFVHGGPASRFDQGFTGYLGHVYPPHAFAARGYAVFRPNPRGTGGYGQRFRELNRGDWGGMDWIDINSGIDALIAQGIADPNRLGMMGWSYGGFITSWTIGQTDRFKALSIGAPVVDLLSFHGTTDIREFIPSYFPPAPAGGETPGETQPANVAATDAPTLEAMRHTPLTLEALRARSPLWNLRRIAAPVLIQHGEADDRVPLSQGTMLYRMLQELGVKVTMVVYPRTPHVPREPKLRMDVARRNIEFFDKAMNGGQ